ncbi:hypothetical protein [Thermogymnomonas acidicola]|uniref:hypothetical protein n=1 Tax=Thermogymnomonas acidicola TaxID=399579 RepID=UPI001396A3A1|nr:hypothetical protein [Thermogymnomonas acidicola]
MPTAKVSEDLGIPYNTVKRRLNTLFSRHLIEVVPLIDLSKTDGVLFSIFTENMPQISGAFNEGLVFAINDERSGILVFFVENLPTAKGIIERARRIDPGGAETMVIFDYQFF